MFKLTNISTILFITTAINIVVTIISWRRQNSRASRYFAWAMLTVTLWTFASAWDYSVTTTSLKILFAKFEFLFYHCSLTFFVLFALAYSGYQDWLNKLSSQILLWSVVAINSFLVFTNEWHKLIWSGFTNNELLDNVLIFYHGPGFLWIVSTNYVFILTIFFFLWKAAQSASELTRRQSRFLLWATGFPIATNLLYLFDVLPATEGVDLTAITFSVSGFLFLMALYGTRFLNIIPIAHHIIIERMPDCVLVLDHNNYVVDFNPAMHEKFGVSKNHLGEKIETIMTNWPEILRLTYSEAEFPSMEIIVDKPTLGVFDTRLTRLTDEHGQLYGKLIVFRNMTSRYVAKQALHQQLAEVHELHEKVRYIAERDSLTNAYTRRYLYEKLTEMITDEKSKPQFIVALLDIDKFKQINDVYGHSIGDEVLVRLTNELFGHVRECDIVCRYGGEEFVVVMPDMPMDKAALRFEQVRKKIQEIRFSNLNFTTTISIGLTEYPIHGQGIDAIFTIADKAMYQAKKAGGNQIVIFSEKIKS